MVCCGCGARPHRLHAEKPIGVGRLAASTISKLFSVSSGLRNAAPTNHSCLIVSSDLTGDLKAAKIPGHDKYCVSLKQGSETLVLPLDGLNDFQVGLMPDHRRFGPGELQVVIEGGRLEIAVVGLHQQ